MNLKVKRWLRALALAKLLFDDEGYFIDYLVEIEELVKNRYPELNGLVIEIGIVNKKVAYVERHRHLKNYDHYQTAQDDESLVLIIDTAGDCLSYTNIGEDFSVDNMVITVCYDSQRIICRVKIPAN